MLGSLTACTMAGWWQVATGADGGVKSAGFSRALPGALTYYVVGTQYLSHSSSVKFRGVEGAGAGDVAVVQQRHIFHEFGECGWDTIACNGVGISSVEGKVTTQTFDTNGDGYVSGAADFQAPYGGNCGMTDGATAYTGARMPYASIWVDTPTCSTPGIEFPYFTSAMTDVSQEAWGGTFTTQDPSGTNMALQNLPFQTVQDIINSIDASDVRTVNHGGAQMQAIKMQITNVRIGGMSYKPVNVFVDVHNFGAIGLDLSKEPGLKLLAAWAANAIDTQLDRGATSLRWSVELNNAVTISRESLGPNLHVTDLNRSTAESWRKLATSNLRSE